MSVDISCRKCPGAEEDLCMPVILQLLLACLILGNFFKSKKILGRNFLLKKIRHKTFLKKI
jgi:hypothetical protein